MAKFVDFFGGGEKSKYVTNYMVFSVFSDFFSIKKRQKIVFFRVGFLEIFLHFLGSCSGGGFHGRSGRSGAKLGVS